MRKSKKVSKNADPTVKSALQHCNPLLREVVARAVAKEERIEAREEAQIAALEPEIELHANNFPITFDQ